MKPIERQLVAMATVSVAALGVTLGYFVWGGGSGASGRRVAGAPVSAVTSAMSQASFVDVTDTAGVTFTHRTAAALSDIRQITGAGVGVGDFDADGRFDFFLVGSADPDEPSGGTPSAVYLNRGGMRFESLPLAGGAWSGEFGMGCTLADYDGDGDVDAYVTALGPNRLYRNDGAAHFDEVAHAAGVADPLWSTAAAFADADLDGDLDLYVANYVGFDASAIPAHVAAAYDRDEPPAFSPYIFPAQPDRFYRNNGDATFSDATAASGIVDVGGKGLGVAFADLNDDRLPDLVVVNDVSPNAFFLNLGGGKFADRSLISGLADPRSGMGIAVADYDDDGAFDLCSTHWQDEANVLYRNLSLQTPHTDTPLFDDVTMAAGLATPSIGSTGWGACWGDFDNDGDQDLFVVNGYTSPAPGQPSQCIGQPAMLFVQENGRFVDRAARYGLGHLSRWAGRGAVAADLDDDGDLDLVVTTNNGPARVLENRVASGHWLKVRPSGGQVIGAVVRITAGGRTQQRMLLAGESYLSSAAPIAHFGLGAATSVERVDVRWPDGETVIRTDVRADQVLTVPRTD